MFDFVMFSIAGYVNEFLKVCWLGIVFMLLVSIFQMCKQSEREESFIDVFLGIIFTGGGIISSVIQLLVAPVLWFAVSPAMGIFLLLPMATSLVAMGSIFNNNPHHVGQFLCSLGIPMMVVGAVTAMGYSYATLFGCAWRYYIS